MFGHNGVQGVAGSNPAVPINCIRGNDVRRLCRRLLLRRSAQLIPHDCSDLCLYFANTYSAPSPPVGALLVRREGYEGYKVGYELRTDCRWYQPALQYHSSKCIRRMSRRNWGSVRTGSSAGSTASAVISLEWAA